jgi:hypothetical protein
MATLLPFGFLGATDPFRELRRLQNEMDRVTGTLSAAGELATAGAFPAVNVYAGQEGIAVVAKLPGVDKDDLEIQGTTTLLLCVAPVGQSLRGEKPITGGRGGAGLLPAVSSYPTGLIPVASKRTSRTEYCA